MKRATNKRRKTRRASANGNSKADSIRQAFATLGRTARPRDVIAHLKQKGVIVSSGQVSTMRPRKGAAARKQAKRAPNGNGHGFAIEHLLAAKELAGKVGGIPAASKALAALELLLN